MTKYFSLAPFCFAMTMMLGTGVCSAGLTWVKGQIHNHTTNSDGTGSPQQVDDWYRTHGYQFLIITDHEKVTDPSPLDKGPDGGFIMIPGEELAVNFGTLPVHANALGLTTTLKSPAAKATAGKTAANLVEYIRQAGALPMINHPNWHYALTHRDLMSVKGAYLLEIANMSSGCNNEGDNAHITTEQIWDYLLSNGKTVYATASDDMHHLQGKPEEEDSPGRGWVVARVAELTPKAVMDALAKGEFYASTGVELSDCSFDGSTLKVSTVKGEKRLFRFIGKGGAILQESMGNSASYKLTDTGPDAYVRCKVISSDGTVAWTQAYRIR